MRREKEKNAKQQQQQPNYMRKAQLLVSTDLSFQIDTFIRSTNKLLGKF